MKRKGKIKMWILIVLGVLALTMGGGILFTGPGRRELMEMTFAAMDFKSLPKGTYIGEYKGTKDQFRNEKVQVTISENGVAGIKVLEGPVLKEGKPVEIRNGLTIDDLSQRIVMSQSLAVDVISGATLTSKAHLRAVENALSNARGK